MLKRHTSSALSLPLPIILIFNGMNKHLPLYIIAILGVITSSCTERIEVELDSTYTRLVVYGEITTEARAHQVRLSKSADYFSNQPAPPVENAVVRLNFDDQSLVLQENEPGIYETPSDFFGIPGKTYSLVINSVDIDENGEDEEYTAESFLPAVGKLDSITLKYTENSFFSGWEVQVWAWDPADAKNFYAFKSIKNGVLQSDTLNEIIVQSDDFFDGNYTYGITSQFLDDAKENEKALPGDTITFQLDGITEDYYVFILEAQAEAFGSNPLFSGPPANVVSNISNGAIGYFTAYSLDRASKVVPEIE